jgi:hypothetical protein
MGVLHSLQTAVVMLSCRLKILLALLLWVISEDPISPPLFPSIAQ